MLRVGFLQFEPRFGRLSDNLVRIEEQLHGSGADLVVLPELAATGYNFPGRESLASLAEPIPGGPTVRRLEELARRENIHLVVGLAERVGEGSSARFYNSAALITPRGHAGTYRKVHLFDREKLIFESGDLGFPVFTLDLPQEPRIGLMVCFDWRFPEAARSLALKGANILAHPSNLIKPYCQAAMITRCLENRVFAVTANRTGVEEHDGLSLGFTGRSQIVDPEGEILASAGPDDVRLAVVSIDITAARTKAVNANNDVIADRRPAQYG